MCSRLVQRHLYSGHMEDRVHWTNQNPMQRTPFSCELLRSCWHCHDPYYDKYDTTTNDLRREIEICILNNQEKNLNIMVAVNKAILRIGERTHVARSIGNAKWWRRAIFAEQSEMRDLDLKHLGVPAMYIKTSYSLLEHVGEMHINILRRKQG